MVPKGKEETWFAPLEHLIQFAFSITPALIHPSFYSCLNPFEKKDKTKTQNSVQIISEFGKFPCISSPTSCCTDTTACALTLPTAYRSVGHLCGEGRGVINFGGSYFLQLARGLKAISCISAEWQSFRDCTRVLFPWLSPVQCSASGLCFRV